MLTPFFFPLGSRFSFFVIKGNTLTNSFNLPQYVWSMLIFLFGQYPSGLAQQAYSTYITGNPADTMTQAGGGICLMGGATEQDDAMRWFLAQANGGDVLILRTSGADGYNDYFYSELGVSIHSAETIIFHEPSAAYSAYIHQRIQEAEAIWLAGGDQWDYVQYWRGTPIDSLINAGLAERALTIGGTSAGMAVLGDIYFSAAKGTVRSVEALQAPLSPEVAVDTAAFLRIPQLNQVITDTHYDNPDRRGRHVAFLARSLQMGKTSVRGIGCDEYTAVCISPNGIARVYGSWPTYDDYAYFIRPNCALPDRRPETITTGQPLTWTHQRAALQAYRVPGTKKGTHYFDLNNWQDGAGGSWQYWFVDRGLFGTRPASAPSCVTTKTVAASFPAPQVYPNPSSSGQFIFSFAEKDKATVMATDLHGRRLPVTVQYLGRQIRVSLPEYFQGMALLHLSWDDQLQVYRLIK